MVKVIMETGILSLHISLQINPSVKITSAQFLG